MAPDGKGQVVFPFPMEFDELVNEIFDIFGAS